MSTLRMVITFSFALLVIVGVGLLDATPWAIPILTVGVIGAAVAGWPVWKWALGLGRKKGKKD